MSSFKPLLAATHKDKSIKYPVLVSPKLDGIRCVIKDGKALTRSLKPIPNKHVREMLESHAVLIEGCDGELMVGTTFSETTSAIMSHDGKPDFTFHVFDLHHISDPFEERYRLLSLRALPMFCQVVQHHYVEWDAALLGWVENHLEAGYEGTMIRSLDGRYKHGRSTVKEGILIKIKPMEDSEAEIIGFEEQMTNTNEQTENELGRSKRSSKKDGMVPNGTLGKFLVRGTEEEHFGGVEFTIGTGDGLTNDLRDIVWLNQEKFIGRMIKFKYQKIGSLDKPRIPIFLGFRDGDDL